MIELGILGPVLIVLFMIFTEYSIFFLTEQKVETLSREAAQDAFADCRLITDPATRLACLNQVATNTEGILTHLMATAGYPNIAIGDYKIILTMWQVVNEAIVQGTPVVIGTLAGNSKYKASDFGPDPLGNGGNTNFIIETGGLFTCEIFYKQQASGNVPRSINFFGFNLSLPLLNNTIYTSGVA